MKRNRKSGRAKKPPRNHKEDGRQPHTATVQGWRQWASLGPVLRIAFELGKALAPSVVRMMFEGATGMG